MHLCHTCISFLEKGPAVFFIFHPTLASNTLQHPPNIFSTTQHLCRENQTLFKESKKYQYYVCTLPKDGCMDLLKDFKKKQSGTHMEHEVAQTHLVEPGGNRADRCLPSTFNFFHVKSVFSSPQLEQSGEPIACVLLFIQNVIKYLGQAQTLLYVHIV